MIAAPAATPNTTGSERLPREASAAATIGSLAYILGQSASGSLGAIGFIGVGVAGVVYLITRVRRRLQQRR